MSTKLAVFTTQIVWVIPSCAYTWFPGILLCRFPCLKSLCTLVTSGSIIFLFSDIWFNACSKLLNTAKQKVAIQLYMAFFIQLMYTRLCIYQHVYHTFWWNNFSMTFCYQSYTKTCIYQIVSCIWLFLLTNTKHIPITLMYTSLYHTSKILICLRWCG